MIIKTDGKTYESDLTSLASDGIWTWKKGDRTFAKITDIPIDRKIFHEKAEKQLQENPNELDVDKILKEIAND